MKYLVLILAFLFFSPSFGQEVQTYVNSKGQIHLYGAFPLEILEKDTAYQKWYNENFNAFDLPPGVYDWKNKFSNTEVDIYIGTWCGDSKTWVPRFVKLWDELGLDRSQLNFIALHDAGDKYKQGPNGEEKDKRIHRVPTFIFKEQDKEYARIVEYPVNDLTTDLAQIALGYPSEPNYRAATYLMNLFESKTKEEINENFNDHFYNVYALVGKSKELNTLGYVYLHSGRVSEAITVFYLNTYLFRHEPNVYDSYAEALAIAGEKDQAIANYEKVLALDPGNENAKIKIAELKEKQ